MRISFVSFMFKTKQLLYLLTMFMNCFVIFCVCVQEVVLIRRELV